MADNAVERRSERVTIRLTVSEHLRVKAAAARDRTTLSDFARDALVGVADQVLGAEDA